MSDVDGTLVPNGSHEVSDAVRQAVIAAENAGVQVITVTGRPYELVKGVLNLLGFNGLCVLDGGASIRQATTGELVWSKWLEPTVIRQIMECILPHCVLVDYDTEQIERTKAGIDIDAILDAAPYVYAQVDKSAVPQILEQLSEISDISTHVLVNREEWPMIQEIQVTHIKGNKQHGVQELLRRQGISREEVMAIGDGDNDLPLFKSAGLRVAVANASPALLAAADYIVASVQDDGFVEAVNRFVLHTQ